MDTYQQLYVKETGARIIGTCEHTPGCSIVVDFTPSTDPTDPEPIPEWEGDTEMYWDGQETDTQPVLTPEAQQVADRIVASVDIDIKTVENTFRVEEYARARFAEAVARYMIAVQPENGTLKTLYQDVDGNEHTIDALELREEE